LNNEEDNKDQTKEGEGKVILKGKPKSKLEMEIGKNEVQLEEGESKDIKENEDKKDDKEIKEGDKNELQQISITEQTMSGDKKADDGKPEDANKLSIEQQINIDGNNKPLTADSNIAINIEKTGENNIEGSINKGGDLASLEIAKSSGEIVGSQSSPDALSKQSGGNIIPGSEGQIQIQVTGTGDASIQGDKKDSQSINGQFDIEGLRLLILYEKMIYYDSDEITLETQVKEMNGTRYETIDYDKLKILKNGKIIEVNPIKGENGEIIIQHNEFNINSLDNDVQKEKKGSELVIENINSPDGNENKLNKENELKIESINNEEINKDKKDELKIESQNNEEDKKDEDKKEEEEKEKHQEETYFNYVDKIADGVIMLSELQNSK